jgi:predicted nucleic acid-binding protein
VQTSDLILVDTSVWVRYLRRGADPDLIRQVQGWLGARQVATTGIIKMELLPASRTEAEFQRLCVTLDALEHLMPDDAIWSAAARNGFSLRRSGIIVPTTDLLIATVAQHAGARLAHWDRHFELMAPHLALRTISFLTTGPQPPA